MRLRSRDVTFHRARAGDCAGESGTTESALLALPDGLLQEVASWCRDSATVTALFSTCQAAHQLRSDPTAAALLLTRCPCADHEAALQSCAAHCRGGPAAVVHHVVQLLRIGGGPSPAPPQLLQALLHWACAQGCPATLTALLALPHPPDLAASNGDGSAALQLALLAHPHVTLQAMAEEVGDWWDAPASEGPVAFTPARLATLHLLLHSLPAASFGCTTFVAVVDAIVHPNPPATGLLLPMVLADARARSCLTALSAAAGNVAVLQRALGCPGPALSSRELTSYLHMAIKTGVVAAATLLLEHGASVNVAVVSSSGVSRSALDMAVFMTQVDLAIKPQHLEERRVMCRLLLSRGAVGSPDMMAGLEDLLADPAPPLGGVAMAD